VEEQHLEETGQQTEGDHECRGRDQEREQPWAKQPLRKDSWKPEQNAPGKMEAKPAGKCGKGCWKCGKEGHIEAECPD